MTFNAEVAEVKNAEENGESLCVLCVFSSLRTLQFKKMVNSGSIKVSVFGWSIFEVERRGQSRWLLGVQSKVEVYLSGWHVEQCEIDRTGF